MEGLMWSLKLTEGELKGVKLRQMEVGGGNR
jgi:hypothetical protein